jgi:hypothetical protein
VVFVNVLVLRVLTRDLPPSEIPISASLQITATPPPVRLAAVEQDGRHALSQLSVHNIPTPSEPIGELSVGLGPLVARQEPGKAPEGWSGIRAGYKTEVDRGVSRSGRGNLRISSVDNRSRGQANAYQETKVGAYRGKRVQLSASIKTWEVSDGAGLWFRVDGKDGAVLGFDSMLTPRRKLNGSRDWTDTYLVLDVPENAAALA